MNWKKHLMVFSFAAAFAVCAQEGNLVPNPGFEEDIGKNWQVPSWIWKTAQGKTTFTPEIDPNTSQGPIGTRSLKLKSGGEKRNTYLPLYGDGKHVPLPKGVREYTVSAWVKTTMPNRKGNEAVGCLEFIVSFCDKNRKKVAGVVLGTPWNRVLPEWTELRKDVPVPEDAVSVGLTLKFSGKKSETIAWVDNLYVGPKQAKTAAAPVQKPAEKEAHLVRAIHSAAHDGIYYPGEQVLYELHFRHLKNPGKKAEVSWTIRDFDSVEIAKGKTPITLERRVDLPIAVPKD